MGVPFYRMDGHETTIYWHAISCRRYKCDNKHETTSRTMVGRSENRGWDKPFSPSSLPREAGTHLVGCFIRYNRYHRNCEMTHQRESTQRWSFDEGEHLALKRRIEAAWYAFAAGGYYSHSQWHHRITTTYGVFSPCYSNDVLLDVSC